MDKGEDVHRCYTDLLQTLEQLKTHVPILDPLFKKWQPIQHTLVTLCKVLQRSDDALVALKPIEKKVRMVVD